MRVRHRLNKREETELRKYLQDNHLDTDPDKLAMIINRMASLGLRPGLKVNRRHINRIRNKVRRDNLPARKSQNKLPVATQPTNQASEGARLLADILNNSVIAQSLQSIAVSLKQLLYNKAPEVPKVRTTNPVVTKLQKLFKQLNGSPLLKDAHRNTINKLIKKIAAKLEKGEKLSHSMIPWEAERLQKQALILLINRVI